MEESMDNEDVLISDEELMDKLSKLAGTATEQEQKQNAHTFLHAVATSNDTTKVGNLREEEVGIPKLSLRTLKELELYSRSIANEPEWADWFKERAEIVTSSSLSKDAKLLELSVINRSEVANVTKQRKVNKGWFSSKKNSPAEV